MHQVPSYGTLTSQSRAKDLITSSQVKELAISSQVINKRPNLKDVYVIQNIKAKQSYFHDKNKVTDNSFAYNRALDSLEGLKRDVRREIKRSKYR